MSCELSEWAKGQIVWPSEVLVLSGALNSFHMSDLPAFVLFSVSLQSLDHILDLLRVSCGTCGLGSATMMGTWSLIGKTLL